MFVGTGDCTVLCVIAFCGVLQHWEGICCACLIASVDGNELAKSVYKVCVHDHATDILLQELSANHAYACIASRCCEAFPGCCANLIFALHDTTLCCTGHGCKFFVGAGCVPAPPLHQLLPEGNP